MKKFLITKIKIEQPVWLMIIKWLVLSLVIFILLMFVVRPSSIERISTIYTNLNKQGKPWYDLSIWVLLILLWVGLTFGVGFSVLHMPPKKKKGDK